MADFEITRRDFNKGLAGAALTIAASAGPFARSVLGANDRIGVGLIGAGGMGQFDLKDFLGSFKNGIRLSGMPAFARVESDEHIWNLAHYVRTIQRSPEAIQHK